MFGSTMLEVAIGLVFVYVVLSLICSGLGEVIARIVSLRANTLRRGIASLLDDGGKKNNKSEKNNTGKTISCDAIYNHGLIRGLCPQRRIRPGSNAEKQSDEQNGNPGFLGRILRARREPTWIPPKHFASALINVVTSDQDESGSKDLMTRLRASVKDIEQKHIKEALTALIDSAEDDIKTVRKGIEEWFDSAMEQVTDWYKRRTQLIIALCAVLVCVIVNADTIEIGRTLSQDVAVRASVVAAASRFSKQEAPTDSISIARIASLRADLDSLGIPLGWEVKRGSKSVLPDGWENRLSKLGGLLISIFAVSLGAPFWFSVLDKLLGLRRRKEGDQKDSED